jgi:hypothetical protein
MVKLFGVDFAKTLGSAMASQVEAATLYVITWGDRDPANPGTGLDRQETAITCRGVQLNYSEEQIDGTIVQKDDRMVMLFASTLGSAVPKFGHDVAIEGTRYHVVRVRRDPAAATYTCQVRE